MRRFFRRRIVVWSAVVLVLMCVLLGGGYAVVTARGFQFYGGLTQRVETEDKVVALTLDDGPTDHTPEVLKVLAEAGVRATFYLTGAELAANPQHGAAIAAAGHELGNHSYSHQRMVLVGTDFVAKEVEQTDELIRRTGYTGEITFRPPHGKKLLTLPHYLSTHQRKTIMWDVEPDSLGPTPNRAEIARAAAEQVRPGSIVLLHVMYPSRTESLAAIPELVRTLRANGYRFVTVSGLLTSAK